MAKVDPALWRDMMEYLRRKHSQICRQWFDELEPIDLQSGLLRIHISNAVQQNYLQKKCLDQFMEAAQNVTGALVTVRFITEEIEHAPDPEPSPAAAAVPVAAAVLAPVLSAVGSTNGVEHHVAAVPAPMPVPVRHKNVVYQTVPDEDTNFEQIVISPDYSFENFVTGPGNQLAYAASVAVANQPGTAYNPLFIHGGVGLGKTHLLQAISQKIMQTRPGMKLCYLSCDSFVNQFMNCVQSGKMSEFRHRYRHVDILIIDDIHFLAKKERTQEEFFHTFNELYQSNRQIVISSDSPPSEIPELEDRLVSRFQWGLVANVSKPCFETRVAIIRAKAKIRGIDIPEEVVNYIANRIDSNARELEGAITTILAHAALQNKKIELSLAQTALGDNVPRGASQITIQHIIDAVTAFYNVKISDLQSKRRHKSITGPRQVCMWLARKRTRFSLEEIGGYFGGRDHTTVMHADRKIRQLMAERRSLFNQVTDLTSRIKSQPRTM